MKKIYFFKLYKDDKGPALELSQGYEFRYGKLVYAISKLHNYWSATEISTGMTVGVYSHKLKDIEKAFKDYEERGTMRFVENKILVDNDPIILYMQDLIQKGVDEAIKEKLRNPFV